MLGIIFTSGHKTSFSTFKNIEVMPCIVLKYNWKLTAKVALEKKKHTWKLNKLLIEWTECSHNTFLKVSQNFTENKWIWKHDKTYDTSKSVLTVKLVTISPCIINRKSIKWFMLIKHPKQLQIKNKPMPTLVAARNYTLYNK